jgi:hypothetical protein
MRPDQAPLVFFPSTQRAQVTALACTLPRSLGKPFSRWSSTELTQAVQSRGIAPRISRATIKRWLKEEKIKPWQWTSWQKSTDPLFLEKAAPVLTLYEDAQTLCRQGHYVVCVDEKTSIQARKPLGDVLPASPGGPIKLGCRYERKGALQLFCALLVSSGETMVRCFDRKRFLEFQALLKALFQSLWGSSMRCLHLILDNGTTHAPKQLVRWIGSLPLPFEVRLHWLPVNASWLDQVEIVFSQVQRQVLTPNYFQTLDDLESTLMDYFRTRNEHPKPIRWSYTVQRLQKERKQITGLRFAA